MPFKVILAFETVANGMEISRESFRKILKSVKFWGLSIRWKILVWISRNFQTRFTLEKIVPDSSLILNDLVHRIDFAAYTQVDESEIKIPRFGLVSGEFESGI